MMVMISVIILDDVFHHYKTVMCIVIARTLCLSLPFLSLLVLLLLFVMMMFSPSHSQRKDLKVRKNPIIHIYIYILYVRVSACAFNLKKQNGIILT